MQKLETVQIEGQNGEPVLINKSDFNEEQHVLYGEEDQTEIFDKEAAKAKLKAAGVEFSSRLGEAKLKSLLEELEVKPEFSVIEEDGKFKIQNQTGEFIGADSYDTTEEAELALKLIAGE